MKIKAVLFTVSFLCFAVAVVSAGNPVKELEKQLSFHQGKPLDENGFSFYNRRLSKADAERAGRLIYVDYLRSVRERSEQSWLTKRFTFGTYAMPFEYQVFGQEPPGGRSLYISMHGGGHAPAAVNNGQWENQKRLYRPAEGVYLAPRAAVDDWNMWHQAHVDFLFEEIIRTAVALLHVNPDKVYIMGYSAGGDGAFQLAPRMADHWAAAAMMAGHPDNAHPDNLRNIGFSIWMGEQDGAYDRNKHAAQWRILLDSCRRHDLKGYPHEVHIVPGKGHWMERQDTLALDYLDSFVRNPLPEKIVWRQDDVIRPAFYWLSVPAETAKPGNRVVAERSGNTITILENDYPELTIWLNDQMVDLDRPIRIIDRGGRELFSGMVPRTIGHLVRSMRDRGDRAYLFPAAVVLADATVK